jgi:DNA-binding MarR family transcriptional regulator
MIEKTLQRLAPVIGKENAEALWLAYHVEEDMEARREIEAVICGFAASYLDETFEQEQPLLTPPSPGQAAGNYCTGTVCYGGRELYPFGLREEEMSQHLGIYGRTGAGKTNIVFNLLDTLIRRDKPFLVFDWKHNYRSLLTQHPHAGIRVFTVGAHTAPFCFNPLDLSDIPPEMRTAYIREVISVLISVYFRDMNLLSVEGVEYLLLRAADDILREDEPLSFQTMYEWATIHKGTYREKDWKSSVLNVLYKVTTGPIGSVLNARQSMPVQDLLSGRTILELNWLGSPKDKAFFIQLLLLKLYHHCLQQPERNRFDLEIVIEEAHNILLRHAARETIAEMVLRQVRELGVGVCLTDQHPHLISIPALGTYATIALNLKAEQDVRAMGAAMLLDAEQQRYLGRLPTGWGIVKLQDRFPKPFLARFPLAFSSHQVPTDAELPDLMKEHLPEPPPADQTPELKPPSSIHSARQEDNTGIRSGEAIVQDESTAHEITDREQKFLLDIIAHPFSGMVERYDRLGISTGRGSRIQKKLVEKGFIRSEHVSTGKGGVKVLELTEKGIMALGGVEQLSQGAGRLGGLMHRYWIEKIARKLEQEGYKVEKEYPIGEGRTVDIVAEKDGEQLAVEVETGKSDIISNIEKVLNAGFPMMMCIVADRRLKKDVEIELQRMDSGRSLVQVMTANEMMDNKAV